MLLPIIVSLMVSPVPKSLQDEIRQLKVIGCSIEYNILYNTLLNKYNNNVYLSTEETTFFNKAINSHIEKCTKDEDEEYFRRVDVYINRA